ncbi:MAG: hypothetical protein D6767_10920 [Candidatus Hydrogenedentota bacterium]|nr:MAG: hypothetical protein D6767_10920 [Candidatus Hydrogenedentota bacterium]
MADNRQKKFHRCQNCGKIVEVVYQKGHCRDCIEVSLKKLTPLLNQAHPLSKHSEKTCRTGT